MTNKEYSKLVSRHTPKVDHVKSMSLAFFVGGFIGMFGQGLVDLYHYIFKLSITDAMLLIIFILIFISSLLIGIGVFDKVVEKVRCGIIVPITGFAHAMMSAALEYKHEGLILGIGSNIFKITGSVILYGIVSAYVFGLIRLFVIGG